MQTLADTLHPLIKYKAEGLIEAAKLVGRNGPVSADRFRFDPVVHVTKREPEETIGVEVKDTHTHVTDGIITHNTEQDVRWLSLSQWDACDFEVDPSALEGRECFAGLDLSSTQDISALVLLFPHYEDDEPWEVLPFFWVPGERAKERERKDKVPYLTWAGQGFVDMTEGPVCNYDVIREHINSLSAVYNIRELAIDRWNSTQLQTQLDGDGITVVQFGQGFADMTAPSKELEARVVSRRIAHGGNPVLRWMSSNVAVELDAAGNIKPSKKKSTERIDGVVGLVMALGRAMLHGTGSSVYEERGLLSI